MHLEQSSSLRYLWFKLSVGLNGLPLLTRGRDIIREKLKMGQAEFFNFKLASFALYQDTCLALHAASSRVEISAQVL
jgi:hypothetical protein